MSKSGDQIPSLLERYEMKYLIPESMVDPISDFVSVYCTQDAYSAEAEEGFYEIHSLYLDSPDFQFLRKRMDGSDNRFNMRIRTYDPVFGTPCFFEVKQKRDGIVRKYRAMIHDKDWDRVFEDSDYTFRQVDEEDKAQLFIRLACSWRAEPKVLTRYERKAYISDVDDYARVTFDKSLKCHQREYLSVIPDPFQMSAYDNETVFDPECNVILELKCYAAAVPLWMIDLTRYFNLQRGSFSKYAASMLQTMGNFSYCNADRMTSAACFL